MFFVRFKYLFLNFYNFFPLIFNFFSFSSFIINLKKISEKKKLKTNKREQIKRRINSNMERNKVLRPIWRGDLWKIAIILVIFTIGLHAVQSKVRKKSSETENILARKKSFWSSRSLKSVWKIIKNNCRRMHVILSSGNEFREK